MSRNSLSACGATDEEVVESLQEEFDGMQKTARAFATRCRELEAVLREFVDFQVSEYDRVANRARAYCAIRRRAVKLLGPSARKPGTEP